MSEYRGWSPPYLRGCLRRAAAARDGRQRRSDARQDADLAGELAIPRLAQFGLTDDTVAAIVTLACKSSSMRYNPVELSDEALGEVLRAAM